MNRRNFVMALAGAAGVAGLGAATARADRWDYRRYRRNDVDATIRRCEESTDRWVKVFDEQLDNSVLNDSEREDRLNEKARELERALDRLRQDFNRRGESWWECRSSVADALLNARGINNSVRSRNYRPHTKRLWALLRSDLNRLAYYYGLPGVPR